MLRLRLRNRRGAVTIWFGVHLMLFLLLTAVVYDIGYWWVVQSELQTTADAAALRGALRLQRSTAADLEGDVDAVVTDFAAANNPAQGEFVALDPDADVCLERWNPTPAGEAPPNPDCYADGLPPNAVAVRPRQASVGVFGKVYGNTANPTVKRMAVAWIANVNGEKCVKPWGLPQPVLVSLATGTTTTSDRALTATEVIAISEMSDLQRTVVIGPSKKLYDPVKFPGVMHGNWAPIRFSQDYTTAANQGIDEYMKLVAGKCLDGSFFSIGDAVETDFPGASVEKKTSEAIENGACTGNCKDGVGEYEPVCYFPSSTSADCYEDAAAYAAGTRGKRIRVAWTTVQTGMGADPVTARTFGEFVLQCYVRKNGDSCSQPRTSPYDSPIKQYPEGTLIGQVIASFNERMGPEVELGNAPSLSQVIMLVK